MRHLVAHNCNFDQLQTEITSCTAVFFTCFWPISEVYPLYIVNVSFPTQLKWTKVEIFNLKVTANPGRKKIS